MVPPVLGLDVGGANLKAAHSEGASLSQPYELWKNPAGLADALRNLLTSLPPAGRLAVTMTGELCDCFATKRDGVRAILDAVAGAAGPLPVRVWTTAGCLVDLEAARLDPLPAAAANWLALATIAGRWAPHGPALLVDVGSTTADVIPLLDGLPVPRGRTDPERLRTRELVYTGVRRTPVCALAGENVMAELFATTLDVYLLLGDLPEDAGDRATADGQPATRRHAHFRLARMLGGDGDLTPAADTLALAGRVRQTQQRLLTRAFAETAATLPGPPQTLITSGSGEFLIRSAWDNWQAAPSGTTTLSLAECLGPELSRAACAHAVARLEAEREG